MNYKSITPKVAEKLFEQGEYLYYQINFSENYFLDEKWFKVNYKTHSVITYNGLALPSTHKYFTKLYHLFYEME